MKQQAQLVLKKLYPKDWEEILENIKDEGKMEEFKKLSTAEEIAHFIYTFMN